MKNYYESGASVTPPATPGTSLGYPTDGVPGSVAATIPGAFLWHAIVSEIMNAITGSGQTPSATDLTQLATALAALRTVPVAGGWNLPGGLQIRFGTHTNTVDDETVTFATPFTTTCDGVIPSIVGANASSNVNVQWSTPTRFGFSLHAQAQERATFYIAIGR